MHIHHVSLLVLLELYLGVSEGEVCRFSVSNRFLHFFYVFRVVGVVQSLPKWSLSLSHFNVTSFCVCVCMVIKFGVHVKSCLLEVSICWIRKKLQYRSKDSAQTASGFLMNLLLEFGMSKVFCDSLRALKLASTLCLYDYRLVPSGKTISGASLV